jgi:hypothetical protein
MKEEDRLLGLNELMKVAAKTDALARQAWEESKAHRISGRLARDPRDVGALSYTFVESAKNGNAYSLEIPEEQGGWFLLQISMQEVSCEMWEELWNVAHPDRLGEAWDGKDFGLMSVWRRKVRTMIKECRQEAILDMTAEEYFNQLTAAGANGELAQHLADWILKIHEGDTPST